MEMSWCIPSNNSQICKIIPKPCQRCNQRCGGQTACGRHCVSKRTAGKSWLAACEWLASPSPLHHWVEALSASHLVSHLVSHMRMMTQQKSWQCETCRPQSRREGHQAAWGRRPKWCTHGTPGQSQELGCEFPRLGFQANQAWWCQGSWSTCRQKTKWLTWIDKRQSDWVLGEFKKKCKRWDSTPDVWTLSLRLSSWELETHSLTTRTRLLVCYTRGGPGCNLRHPPKSTNK